MSRKAPAGSAMPIRVAAEQLRMVPIDDLVPYANNARTHGKAQIAQLRASLREFGFVVLVVIDGANNVIAGHGRLLAARAEGMTEVPCILAGCLTEAQRKAYILADNRLSEAASWDKELLRLELAALEKLNFHTEVIGFDTAALEEIPVSAYTRAAPGQAAPEAEPEAGAEECADQVPEACPYRPGDVFKLGRHLLVCGDCTNPEVTKNFRGGVDLLLTDPPYGVGYAGKTTERPQIQNDALESEGLEYLLIRAFRQCQERMKAGAGFYIWYPSVNILPYYRAMTAVGWRPRQVLIWNKSTFVLGRQDYHWKHESCFYGWCDGAAHFWDGGHAQATVLDHPRPVCSSEHPTMKPVPLFDRLIRNSCPPGGTVYDPFGGSGTTLLACEQSGRTCWMVELDPRYIAATIRRWEAMNGGKAQKINCKE